MENAYHERSGFMGGVARVLNSGGSAAVYAYDVTSAAVVKALSVAKEAPVLPEKVMRIFTSGIGLVRPSETKHLDERIGEYEKKIQEYEKKIKKLYLQIGKEGADYSGDMSALETEPIKNLIANVREYEKEIQRLQGRIVEIKGQEKADVLRRKELKKAAQSTKKRVKVTTADEKVKKKVESAIAKAVRYGKFDARSEREIFDKVANDLLDSEIEIKLLAAAELGKIGNKAAVPILMEAVGFDNSDLTSEIINSLITIGDSRAIPLFKEKAPDPKYRVRIGCLRGLYKLAKDEEAIPVLVKALRDEHPEVRRTAATYIGWKDYADAVPALAQCLRDEDARVRKASVSALANIKDISAVLPLIKVLGDKELEIREKAFEAVSVISGEEITFDVHASGKALKEAINNLRDWWQQERLGKVDITEATPSPGEPELTEEKLIKMTKAELLSICKEHGIECDEKQTKAEIAQLILGEKK